MNAQRAQELFDAFRGKHVLVVGDVMLDEFVRGDVTRVSPEAPVPVVDMRERFMSPGGAGNAAANVVSFGGRATVVGLVGQDRVGGMLREALAARGIDTHALVASGARVTTHKLRVIAHTQQIVRVDSETRDALSLELEGELVAAIERVMRDADAVLVSDYAKGVVTNVVARAAIASAAKKRVPVVVDPKGRDYSKYTGATVITPNVLELETVSGVHTENADGAIVEAGRKLLESHTGTSLLVTRGARGMTLLERGTEPLHLPTLARAVYDVTGAGDTVVGTLVLALAGSVSMADALTLASHAARIAVSKVGTAAVSADELLDALQSADA
jgi:D-glycero-beta-D-manno-heptose-7-phosphate kinase